MVSIDTFLIALYVEVDEFCKRNPPTLSEQTIWASGRKRQLSRSEVVTLSIFANGADSAVSATSGDSVWSGCAVSFLA